jgi:hypothetical protein
MSLQQFFSVRSRNPRCSSSSSSQSLIVSCVVSVCSRAVPLLKQLVAGFPPRRPGSRPGRAREVCGGQSGTGVGFLRVLRFPLPIIIPPTSSLQSSGAGTMGLLVAVVPSGPNWTPPPLYQLKFSLSNCPQHSLKALLLLNHMCLLKYVLNCEQNVSFFIHVFRS